jgi:HAD superfamily hydrolase (TIGR01509 family)
MASKKKKAALLDIDGTLLDSNHAHAQAWIETLAEFGHTVGFDRVRHLIGKGGDKLLPEVTGIEKDSPEGKRISERRSAVFKEKYLPGLRPFDGARELLQAMKQGGLKLVVATSAQKDELAGLLARANVTDLIEEATTSSDAEESKPDPDIVLAALRSAGCSADEAIMLGDTPYDVEASTRAGVAIVAVRCGGWSDADLGGAVAVYDDPRDLLAGLPSSPFFAPG